MKLFNIGALFQNSMTISSCSRSDRSAVRRDLRSFQCWSTDFFPFINGDTIVSLRQEMMLMFLSCTELIAIGELELKGLNMNLLLPPLMLRELV